MEESLFDTEHFIEEIKSRRAIWDMESTEYRNRVLKRSAWQQLVEIFSKEDSTEEEKKILGATLQKKWKNLRDNFAREMKKKKRTKSGSGASNATPYIYFTRLQFLESTVMNKATIDSLDKEVTVLEDDNEDITALDNSSHSPVTVPKKTLKLNAADKHFSDILQKSIAIREEREIAKNNEDEDKLFCLSLYKELKKVPEHGRIKTKIQLLETIQRAQELYNPTPMKYHQHPIHHYQHPPMHEDVARAFPGSTSHMRVQPAASPSAQSFTSENGSDIMDLY